jgi:hypothetical protein
MDMAAQMLQFPQFGLVERGANAEAAYPAIGTGLPDRLTCDQRNLHASLQGGRRQPNELPIRRILMDPPFTG